MDPGCSDRGQWFPFPCQSRGKHRDTDGCFMAMSGRMSSAAELRSLSLPSFHPHPPRLSLLRQPNATLRSVLLPSLCIFCLCLGATVAAPDSLRSGVTGHGLL